MPRTRIDALPQNDGNFTPYQLLAAAVLRDVIEKKAGWTITSAQLEYLRSSCGQFWIEMLGLNPSAVWREAVRGSQFDRTTYIPHHQRHTDPRWLPIHRVWVRFIGEGLRERMKAIGTRDVGGGQESAGPGDGEYEFLMLEGCKAQGHNMRRAVLMNVLYNDKDDDDDEFGKEHTFGFGRWRRRGQHPSPTDTGTGHSVRIRGPDGAIETVRGSNDGTGARVEGGDGSNPRGGSATPRDEGEATGQGSGPPLKPRVTGRPSGRTRIKPSAPRFVPPRRLG